MPPISSTDRAAVADCLRLLNTCAGEDGRLSDDDIRTASRTKPAAAPLVKELAAFLRDSTRANGHTIVSMKHPLGNRETSAAKICDEFLANHTVPAAAPLRSRSAPLRYTRHWQAVEANERSERDALEAQRLSARLRIWPSPSALAPAAGEPQQQHDQCTGERRRAAAAA